MLSMLDHHLIAKIRYEYLENPKLNYDNLVRYLKKVFKVTCSSRCRFRNMNVYNGEIYYINPLLRQTHASCIKCNFCVSDYSHSYCHNCAPDGSLEYLYHHSKCNKDIEYRYIEALEDQDIPFIIL